MIHKIDSLYQECLDYINQNQQNMKSILIERNTVKIFGLFILDAVFEKKRIIDEYFLEIFIPIDYQQNLPKVFETDNKISKDYHKLTDDSFCLGCSFELKRILNLEPSVNSIINNLITPYLYSHSYYMKNGKMPFGELKHGIQGIVDYYLEYFKCKRYKLCRILGKILTINYRGHHHCFCGSKKIMRRCHGEKILEVIKLLSEKEIYKVMNMVFVELNKGEKKKIIKQFNDKEITKMKEVERESLNEKI